MKNFLKNLLLSYSLYYKNFRNIEIDILKMCKFHILVRQYWIEILVKNTF